MNRRDAKGRARTLRTDLAAQGEEISHAAALERVARAEGFRDWNTMSASLTDGWQVGDRVRGQYLGRDFDATVLTAQVLPTGWTRLTLDLDEAVDVVRFDSFSAMRKRITATIGPKGTTAEQTSDGVPHLIVRS
ncbi:glyoxalase superfamily protein [Jannaschia sp. M317]|uniref:glyoxalase superfamily protein n=1 Tax=Jannaschia sp. M317 TaxID=2867011 RepID=UPI0021A976A7|nr:glyoxalase superfamily protein [Jannaschia sp. M317]UWQ18409.1 hypothetical protein K3551_03640 [Jannaschia sp. M317]